MPGSTEYFLHVSTTLPLSLISFIMASFSSAFHLRHSVIVPPKPPSILHLIYISHYRTTLSHYLRGQTIKKRTVWIWLKLYKYENSNSIEPTQMYEDTKFLYIKRIFYLFKKSDIIFLYCIATLCHECSVMNLSIELSNRTSVFSIFSILTASLAIPL